MLHRFTLGRTALAAVVVSLAVPAGALADGGGPSVLVGPVSVGHGYSLEASGYGCGSKYASGSITFTKTVQGGSEGHDYFVQKASCSISKDLSKASLTIDAGSYGTIDVKFAKHGKVKKGAYPKGENCSGPKPLTQPGEATGKFKVNIAPAVFGKVDLKKVQGSTQMEDYQCRGPLGKIMSLGAGFGPQQSSINLNADRPSGGPSTVDISTYGQVNSTISVSHDLMLTGGKSLFKAAANASSATVSGIGKLVSGQLKFTADPSCTGSTRTGTLAGKLIVKFDVIGKQTLNGPSAQYANLGSGGQRPCSG